MIEFLGIDSPNRAVSVVTTPNPEEGDNTMASIKERVSFAGNYKRPRARSGQHGISLESDAAGGGGVCVCPLFRGERFGTAARRRISVVRERAIVRHAAPRRKLAVALLSSGCSTSPITQIASRGGWLKELSKPLFAPAALSTDNNG